MVPFLNGRSAKLTAPIPQPTRAPSAPRFASFREAALFWREFGFDVIPIRPRTKAPAVLWTPWLRGLSRSRINAYWREHPDHEVGFIVGDKFIVFDADTAEALAALQAAEMHCGVMPSLVVKTKRGAHHYFRRSAETPSRLSALDFPECLDVKTGRTMVILPPSRDKTIVYLAVSQASELAVASQAFIDALKVGQRKQSAPTTPKPQVPSDAALTTSLRLLQACLARLDPDLPYTEWYRTAAVIFHETGANEVGFALFDQWSRAGRKYVGEHDARAVWQSLRLDYPKPATIATLRFHLQADGHDWAEICGEADDPFEATDGEGE